jgi:hypothetical protein
MTAQPRSRRDVARRLAASLGTELRPELLEIVPPVGWDEFPTRTELRDELRRHQGQVDRRLRAVRDALAAAHQDELRRLIGWSLALLAAVAGLVTVALRSGRRSRTGAA